MPRISDSAEYSIAAVSKLTGIGCHTLRVWERRYGFPVPGRSASGHRRYGAEQVQTLGQVAQKLRDGSSISDLITKIRDHTLEDTPGEKPISVSHGPPRCPTILDRLQSGDLAGAEACYEFATKDLDPADQVELVIEPSMVEIGERWFRGEWDIFQEHAATGFFRRKLDVLINSAQANNASSTRMALVGTVQGDRHEGGVLMICLLLELAGWRAQPMGVDIPVREYQKAVDLWSPDAICLSFILSRNVNKRFAELERIRGVPVYLGGRSILNYQGLARRHGLRPVIGPAREAVAQLIAEVETESPRPRASR